MNTTSNDKAPEPSPEASPPDKKKLAVLRAAERPDTLDGLTMRSGVPRSTTHRHLQGLCEAGLVMNSDAVFQATDAGRRVLAGRPVANLPPTDLERVWPSLKLVPTPVHRAIMTLVLLLALARQQELGDDIHPGVVLIGKTKKLKSLLIRLCCLRLGADPKACQVLLMGTRGRGLVTRLNARGTRTYTCDALAQPLIWLNEGGRLEPSVKRDVQELFCWSKKPKIENDEVVVAGVPVFETNGVKEADSLAERLGFDAPLIRRTFVCDVSKVEVTSQMRAGCAGLLQKFRALGPLQLPPAPKNALPEVYQQLLDSALEECVVSNAVDYVDPAGVLTPVLAARALLPDREALTEVLYNVFLFYDTTGFLREDWRSRLAILLAPEPPPPPPPKMELAVVNATPREVDPLEGPNPYDLDENLLGLKHDLAQLRAPCPEGAPLTRRILGALLPLAAQGMSAQQIAAVVAQLPLLARLRAVAERAKLQEGDLLHLAQLAVGLRQGGWTKEHLERFFANYSRLTQLGFSLADTLTLAEHVHAARAAHPELEEAIRDVLERARTAHELQILHDQLAADVSQLQAQGEALRQQLASQETERQRRAQENAALETEKAQRLEDLKEVLQQLTDTEGELAGLVNARDEAAIESEELRRYERLEQARTSRTLAVSELLLDPARPLDEKLADLVRDFLGARIYNNPDRAAELLTRLDRRAQELLNQLTLLPDEVEARKALLLRLRDECTAEEERLKKQQHLRQLAERKNLVFAWLSLVLVPENAAEQAIGARVLPELFTLIEIMAGRGCHFNPEKELEAQFKKVLAVAAAAVASLPGQARAPTPGAAHTTPAVEGATQAHEGDLAKPGEPSAAGNTGA